MFKYIFSTIDDTLQAGKILSLVIVIYFMIHDFLDAYNSLSMRGYICKDVKAHVL